MPTTEDLAHQLEAHKGFRFSAAYMWESAPFRPDDEVYVLLRSIASPGRIDLLVRVDGALGPDLAISIWNPGKLKATTDELRIRTADKTSFGDFFEAAQSGDNFRVTRDGKPGSEFPKKDLPALRLVAAPF